MKLDWQECFRNDPEDEARFCISLNARGDIAMSCKSWLAFSKPWFVVLLFDPESRLIGIKPVKPGTRNAFPVRPNGPSQSRVIRAARLLRQFEIEITQTLRFAQPNFANGVWILDLTSAFVPPKVTRHWRLNPNRRSLTVREA